MIILSNGLAIEYAAASGALGFHGRGWFHERMLGLIKWQGDPLFAPSFFTVILKTITLPPRQGHPLAVWFIKDGVVNAISLRNKGLAWFVKNIGPKIDPRKISAIPSISGKPGELGVMARALNGFNFMGLEINVSCANDFIPETAEVIKRCEVVKKNSRFPLILKLSVAQDVKPIVKEVYSQGLIEAFKINSVPWKIVFPNRQSPFARLGGGAVSGKAAQPYTWDLVKRLTDLSPIPVFGPSVWDFEDMEKVRKRGAQAIEFGSIFLRYPWRPVSFILKEQRSKFF